MSPKQRDRNRDGISIEDRWQARGRRTGKRWLAKVRDTRLHRYKRRAFTDLEIAKDWAKQTRARFELAESSAGKWPLEDVITEYAAQMRRDRAAPRYVKVIEWHGKMLQSVGVRDLTDDGLHTKVRLYLALPTHKGHRRHDGTAPSPCTVRLRYTYARMMITYAMRYPESWAAGIAPYPGARPIEAGGC